MIPTKNLKKYFFWFPHKVDFSEFLPENNYFIEGSIVLL